MCQRDTEISNNLDSSNTAEYLSRLNDSISGGWYMKKWIWIFSFACNLTLTLLISSWKWWMGIILMDSKTISVLLQAPYHCQIRENQSIWILPARQSNPQGPLLPILLIWGNLPVSIHYDTTITHHELLHHRIIGCFICGNQSFLLIAFLLQDELPESRNCITVVKL